MESKSVDVGSKQRKGLIMRPWLWPLLPFFAIRWMVFGGWKWTWDEFLVHLACHCEKDESGNPTIMYFLTVGDFAHFHPMVWGGYALAATLAWAGQGAADKIGLCLIGLLLYSGMTVTLDLPFRRFVKVLAVIALMIGADFGLSVAAERLDATLVASNWPKLALWAERGVLRPVGDFVNNLDTSVSVGFLVLFSTIWAVVVGYEFINALLFNRYGFDGEHLIHWVLGETQRMIPVYYQKSELRNRDMGEAIFGFGSLKIGVKGAEFMELNNIPFMALPGRQAQISHIIARKPVDPTEVATGDSSGSPGALRNPRRTPEDAVDAGG